MNPTRRREWQALIAHRATLADSTLRAVFEREPQRTRDWTIEACGLRLDLSRHLATRETLERLIALARACDVDGWRARLFAGEAINNTEQRPAWHTALRTPPANAAVAREVAAQCDRFLGFADDLRAGRVRGAGSAPIDTVICFGIGGSDLGPRLAAEALGNASGACRLRFVTNIDPTELDTALADAQPERTLLVVVSKSFSTLETLENAKAARAWFAQQVPALDVKRHLWAISSQPDKAAAFGVPADQVLTFPDWVGGRYSVWSACGFPVALAHGSAVFRDLLAGAATMDEHFRQAPAERNAPLLLALLGLWYVNFMGLKTRVVMPYAQRLRYLAPYLQQLEMESLGKRVDRDGLPLDYDTGAVVWGDVGTTAQHSVFQFLHQGTQDAPIDFITSAEFETHVERRLQLLHANALAQADALAFGDAALGAAGQGKPLHAQVPGNRPSSFITLPRLDARSLGALLALYEHRTFVQSVVWNINAFDQWGVEIGKKLLAQRLAG